MKVINWKESRNMHGVVCRVELHDHSFTSKDGKEIAYYTVTIDSWTEDKDGDTLKVRYNLEKEFDSFKDARNAFESERI